MNKFETVAPQTANITTPAQSAQTTTQITTSASEAQTSASIAEVTSTPATENKMNNNTTTREDDIDMVAYRRIHALANCAGELILATYSRLFPYAWEKDGLWETQNSKLIDGTILTCTCRDKYIQVQLTTTEGVFTLFTVDEAKNLPPHNCGPKQ